MGKERAGDFQHKKTTEGLGKQHREKVLDRPRGKKK